MTKPGKETYTVFMRMKVFLDVIVLFLKEMKNQNVGSCLYPKNLGNRDRKT